MFKKIILLFILFSFHFTNAQIKLKTNVGDDLIDSEMITCEYEESWSKIFTLSDFGIGTDEQFHINTVEAGISKADEGVGLSVGVSLIDENFPEEEPWYLGGSFQYLPAINTPRIISFELQNSVVIPAGVDRILVTISINYSSDGKRARIAGTEQDTGNSWFRGCREYYTHTLTSDLESPVPDANFYITAIGKISTINNSGATTTLNHSVCDELIDPYVQGCSYGSMSWARDFYMEDFGISTAESFTINSGQVGIQAAGWGVEIIFKIFKIDDNFPSSFSENDLIGESRYVPIPYFNSTNHNLARIFEVKFDSPITIPPDVERILVMVYQTEDYSYPAATEQDDGSISWFKSYAGGCTPDDFTDIRDLGWPDIKLYINVTGNVKSSANNFGMNFSNNCSEFLKEFSLTNQEDILSVNWDFGDPSSGNANTSSDLSPFHDFSEDGIYNITATIKAKDGTTEIITENIDVQQPPKAYGIENIEACENSPGSGFSMNFDTSDIENQVLRDQTDKTVTYIDGSGNEYKILPNPFSNTIAHRETIKVRVSKIDNLCCYDETSFDLIVKELPELTQVQDIFECSANGNGFSTFDLKEIKENIVTENISVKFYFQDGERIPDSDLEQVTNKVKDLEAITVKALNTETGCSNETTFNIGITASPIAHNLSELTACDDNSDGISEYFDTGNIEQDVLGNQENMEVSYFNEAGDQIATPLPNPYTNTYANEEILTVRVTNPVSGCYSDTYLKLQTSSQPSINKPLDLYSCDTGNGIGSFDLSGIEEQLIGNQSGLITHYTDENGNQLPSPLPENYQNKKEWTETIYALVESESSSICYSETSFDLIVNELPEIDLENEYFLCDLEPFLNLQVDQKLDSWTWSYQDGTVISESYEANLTDAGTYTLKISKEGNGVLCERSFSFNLVRSILPSIEEVIVQDLSDNNHISVMTSGDGDFEFSIDDIHYQESNSFYNLTGGIYTVKVRDKNGCGMATKEVVLVSYPKIHTPNNDGYHDFWQIEGIEKFPGSRTMIYDRYGKFLKQLNSRDKGWDGTFNGNPMPTDDYWFAVYFSDGRTFNGHFSLIRR